jgi:UDP-glucose 4-epimerase
MPSEFTGAAARGLPVVNLGSGKSYSVDEIVAFMSEIVGEKITITTDPARVRKSDRPHLLADHSELKRYFGWRSETDIHASLRETWRDPQMLEALS